MQRIHFSSGATFFTGDAIANALIAHVSAVTQMHRVETVALPTVGADGVPRTATVVVNPASQISAESVPSAHADPTDEALVERLWDSTAALVGGPFVGDTTAEW